MQVVMQAARALTIITALFVQFEWSSANSECKEESTDSFKFLEKSKTIHGYLVVYESDIIRINCSTSEKGASVKLYVSSSWSGRKEIQFSPLFNASLSIDKETYTFSTHLEQDSSILQCEARMADSVICIERGILMVNQGQRKVPVSLEPNITEKTLALGDDFEIKCQAYGHGTSGHSYIKWYRQNSTGKFLVDAAMVQRRSKGGVDIEVLVLKNVTNGVQGDYICERKTTGQATEARFKVLYKEPERPEVSLSTNLTVLRVLEFQGTAFVQCSVVRGSPKPTVVWYHNGLIHKTCDKSARCILNITNPNFPNDEGNFSCIASNLKGLGSKSVVLTVTVPPLIHKPLAKEEESVKMGDVNKDAELQCVVSRSNPLPRFIWFKRVGNKWTSKFERVSIIPNQSKPSNFSKLVIPSSKVTSFFSCQATNVAGSDVKNITLHWKGGSLTTSSGSKTDMILVTVLSCCMIVILLILFLTYLYKRRLEKRYGFYLQPNLHFEFDSNFSLQEQSHRLPYDPKWEFPRDKLMMLQPIGHGAFGEVWLAKAQGILEFKAEASSMSPTKRKRFSRLFSNNSTYDNVEMLKNLSLAKVAVKTLKDDATESEFKDLASELKILIHIGEHQNIVNLLGACTVSGSLCVILEYCPHGDLSSFLRGKRDVFEPSWLQSDTIQNLCTYFDLATFTYQISRGMDFLASKKCVHRDLAARNVLVSQDINDAFIIKIADFGMSRDVYHDGIYTKQSCGVLPLKWTAPESLADAVYTSQSDVWSYGVVLWEIFTLGGSPYPGVATDEFLSYLKSKKRMEQPESCPDEFYQLMLDCWEDNPEMRPTFSKIYQGIGDIIETFADANETYLRLENVASPQKMQDINSVQFNDDVFENIASAETVDSSVRSQCTNYSKSDSDYENLTVLKRSDMEDIKEVIPSVYVPMLNEEHSDVNDNIVKQNGEVKDLLL